MVRLGNGSAAGDCRLHSPRQIVEDKRHHAAASELKGKNVDHRKNDHFQLLAVARKVGQHVLQSVLQQGEQGGPDHGSKNVPRRRR